MTSQVHENSKVRPTGYLGLNNQKRLPLQPLATPR